MSNPDQPQKQVDTEHPVHELEAVIGRLMDHNYSDASISSLCSTAIKRMRPSHPPATATVSLEGTSSGKATAKHG